MFLLATTLQGEQAVANATAAHRKETHSLRGTELGAEFRSELYGGFGYENRGVAGQAETAYAGGETGTELVRLRTALSCDVRSVQLGNEKYFDFRSWMLEAGTGRTAIQPLGFRFRYQIERFSGSNASLRSVIPFLTFDSRWFFCSLGYNFRTLSLYDGNSAKPYFSIEEREPSCAVGVRFPLAKRLSGSIALRNYDDFAAGNFASLGWEGCLCIPVSGYEIRATAGWRPAGATALAAAPSGAVLRVFARIKL